jgi:hypothetical protein
MLYRVGNERDELVFDQELAGEFVAEGLELSQVRVQQASV